MVHYGVFFGLAITIENSIESTRKQCQVKYQIFLQDNIIQPTNFCYLPIVRDGHNKKR